MPQGLVRLIPIPSLRRRLLSKIDEQEFRAAIERAREEGDHERVQELKWGRQHDDRMAYEEAEVAFSKQLLARARDFHVPLPPLPVGVDGESDFWETSMWGERYLTRSGVDQVRVGLRKEEEWRRSQRTHWISWFSAITGLIGALTGLLAIILSKP